jgi:hypothetical protein
MQSAPYLAATNGVAHELHNGGHLDPALLGDGFHGGIHGFVRESGR